MATIRLGRGVIHSEMPQQREGVFHGFQLWLNLPAAEKMRPAEYHNLEPDMIPKVAVGEHRVSVLGGRFAQGDEVTTGPIGDRKTDPHLWDIELNGDTPLRFELNPDLRAQLYLYEGDASVNGESIGLNSMVQLQPGMEVVLQAATSAQLLLLAGRPLREPVVQYGPFVMNSRDEIEQAIHDYQLGTLTH